MLNREVPNMPTEEARKERIQYFRERLEMHEKRIGTLETMTSEMVKISMILESQQKSNEKQDEILEKINDNLTNLNQKSDTLSKRVVKLEDDLKEVTDDNHVNIPKLMRRVGWFVFTVALSAFLAWIFSQLGLS